LSQPHGEAGSVLLAGLAGDLAAKGVHEALPLVVGDERKRRRHERAARLVGAAAPIRDELGGGVPPEFAGRWGDPDEDARRALGEEAYRRARAEGYAMDSEKAVACALRDDDG
jgi:hypothetical protein